MSVGLGYIMMSVWACLLVQLLNQQIYNIQENWQKRYAVRDPQNAILKISYN